MFASILPVMLATLFHSVPQPPPGELALRLDQLQERGRVLYVAAHPDDENTQFLAWAVNSEGYDAAYLSLTRGDGGQNLIGDEQSPLLGVMRTWELLAARDIDGARQFIGAERDFGYSKSSEETLDVWGEEAALESVVRVIRRFEPHVIVTRFPEEGSTHGHHLASARLARLGAEAASDPARFPEHLSEGLRAWSAHRVVHNVPTWRGLPEGADTSDWLSIDVGDYQPLLGRSYGEVAAESRSQHRCQGFGWWTSRGPDVEYFSHVWGEPTNTALFEGVDSSWGALPGGDAVHEALVAARAAFAVDAPERAIPDLLAAYRALEGLPADQQRWTEEARREIVDLVVDLAGLVIDVRAPQQGVAVGTDIELTWSALARTSTRIRVARIDVNGRELASPGALERHTPLDGTVAYSISADADVSGPFWLAESAIGGRYGGSATTIGDTIALPDLVATFTLEVEGETLRVDRPVREVYRDAVFGERTRAVEIMPRATVTPEARVAMLSRGVTSVDVRVDAFDALAGAEVTLNLPRGWSSTPESHEITLDAGGVAALRFEVAGPEGVSSGVDVSPEVRFAEGGASGWRLDVIDYEHIPTLLVKQPASLRLQAVALEPPSVRVGYVMGPGDLVASSLRNVGYEVTMLAPSEVDAEALASLDTLLIGIRAFGSFPELHERLPAILEWVQQGGALVTQYQTNNRIAPLTGPIGPAEIDIGRGRVTVEGAPVQVLDPAHPVFTTPHQIRESDWEGWVQERGLYFASTWDDAWQPLLAMNDPGESDPLQGSLLVLDHGEGYVVYTGISFFRQLPAGVAGAYRLLANVLALGGGTQ